MNIETNIEYIMMKRESKSDNEKKKQVPARGDDADNEVSRRGPNKLVLFWNQYKKCLVVVAVCHCFRLETTTTTITKKKSFVRMEPS